ncbi:hypothetical protein M3Y94_00021700 [Aphelenchoides besseyi]|nr:hypothetical protein M3Y94_00021700 [Aphelenchoides besseyi]
MNTDIAHAYHMLRDHGVPADNIIVFLNDDLTNSTEMNPFPGQLYGDVNKSRNWREGVPVDYTSDDINANNYAAVLSGEADQLKLISGGSGRVLKSGPNDRVFVYVSSHGAPGIILTNADVMTRKQLHQTFDRMLEKKMFKELLFYLDTCYSGSMFSEDMERFTNIYASTAANPHESSYSGGSITANVNGTYITVLLYGEFGLALFNDVLQSDLKNQSISEQVEIIRKNVPGSHVQHYGNNSVGEEAAGHFEGSETPSPAFDDISIVEPTDGYKRSRPYELLESRLSQIDADSEEADQLREKITESKRKEANVKKMAAKIVGKIVGRKVSNSFLSLSSPRITNNDCHHEVATTIFNFCPEVKTTPFFGELLKPLIHLCERGVSSEKLVNAIKTECY